MLELFYISLMSKVVMESIECPEMQSDEAEADLFSEPQIWEYVKRYPPPHPPDSPGVDSGVD
jgi:hypothetical protein